MTVEPLTVVAEKSVGNTARWTRLVEALELADIETPPARWVAKVTLVKGGELHVPLGRPVKLTLTSPQGTSTTTKDVFVDGWPLFFALLLLLILLVLIGFELWRRHRARQRELEALRAAVAHPGADPS